MRFFPFPALCLLLPCLYAAEPEPESSPDFWIQTAEQWSSLRAGEVVILESSGKADTGDSDHAAMAAILIDAPVESVWSLVNDQDRAPDYIKTLLSSRLIKEEGAYSLLQQRVKVGFHKVDYVVRHMPEPPSVIRFARVSGDLKAMDGFWRILPVGTATDAQTLLIYRLSLKPDFPVPAFLIRKSLSENLPDTLISVRDEVLKESDGS